MTRLISLLLTLASAAPAPTPHAPFSPATAATQPSVPLAAAGPALSPQAAAAPTITAPAKLSVKVGRFASVQVTTTGKSLILVSSSSEVDAFREFTDPSVYQFRVIAYTAGTYRVTWVSSLGDVLSQHTTEITTDGKPPPPPIDPVDPVDPVDPLARAMQAAYAADAGADKAKHRDALAGVYTLVAQRVGEAKSLAELSEVLKVLTAKALPAGALAKVRELASAELRAALGTDPAGTFDPARAAATFAKLARVVGGLK